jgi:hypothetical protein
VELAHSIEYLTGTITAEQEKMLCQNPDDSIAWITVLREYLEKKKNPTRWSTNIHRLFGSKKLTRGTIRRCKNEPHRPSAKSTSYN